MIHAFLNLLVESQFDSFLKLIISFLILHNTIINHLFKYYLSLPRSSTFLILRTVSRLAQEPSAQLIDST
jgi:hypothetical protein